MLQGLRPNPLRTGRHRDVWVWTATALVASLALTLVVYVTYHYIGIKRGGLGEYFKHLVPAGLPGWIVPLIFVLEDDAQDGGDHVDSHRSVAFVAGAFVKQGP